MLRGRRAVGHRISPTSSAAWRRSWTRSAPARFPWSVDLEDVHLNIEKTADRAGRRRRQAAAHRALAQRPGRDRRAPVAARPRSTRSTLLIRALQTQLVDLAEQHADTVMPGFTHLQVAQPVSFGHHLLAYYEMLKRDRERLADCRRRVEPAAAGRRRACRHDLSDRPRAGGARARLRRRVRSTRWTRSPIATSPSNSRRRRRCS